MTDRENSALGVLGDHNEAEALRQQVTALQDRLAQYEQKGEVVQAEFRGEVPRYRLNSACYLDDTLFTEGTEIDFLDTPNTEMVPVNEPARQRMQAYLEQLMEGQQAVAAKNGRNAPGLVIMDKGELLAQLGQDARNTPAKVTVSMPEARDEVFGMPHLEQAKAARKRAGKTKRAAVVSVKPPAPPAKVKTQPDRVLGSGYDAQSAGNKVG